MKPDFDVVVIGGAMAGAATAALLATQPRTAGLRVALLEPRPAAAPAPADPLDLRVSALSRASQRLLEITGAWPAVAARGACAYRRMVVWEAHGDAGDEDALVFDAAELGEPDLGHIAENRAVQAALTARALAAGVVPLRAALDSIAAERDAVRIATADGRTLRAALAVAADGGDSAARAQAGIAVRESDYGQRAVVAHLQPERGHRESAWQRFLDEGPLALLPLADGRVSLVWSTTPERAEELCALDEGEFARQVTAASAGVLGALRPVTPRASFPLRLLHARRYAAARLALVGDAAHVVHPLAGQGINLAFLDAAALAEVAGEAVAAGEDPGETRWLRRYERWRRAEATPAVALLDGLQRLFRGGSELQSRLRRQGLGLVQSARPVKDFLMRRALGLAGGVPRALRPPPA